MSTHLSINVPSSWTLDDTWALCTRLATSLDGEAEVHVSPARDHIIIVATNGLNHEQLETRVRAICGL